MVSGRSAISTVTAQFGAQLDEPSCTTSPTAQLLMAFW
jgi:hypothetical protein